MHAQIITYQLKDLSSEEYAKICDSLAPIIAGQAGLIAKVWIADPATNTYGSFAGSAANGVRRRRRFRRPAGSTSRASTCSSGPTFAGSTCSSETSKPTRQLRASWAFR